VDRTFKPGGSKSQVNRKRERIIPKLKKMASVGAEHAKLFTNSKDGIAQYMKE